MKSLTNKYNNIQKPSAEVQPEAPTVQPKVIVNAPVDSFEQEADAISERVMQMKNESGFSTGMIGKSVQRKSETGGEFAAPADLSSRLNNSAGEGSALPKDTRGFMENAFSTDFSSVRVHTDSNAAAMTGQLHAKAFTYGSDIYFKNGAYTPETGQGQKLLAHELTHVVQQRGKSSIQRQPDTDTATVDPQSLLSPADLERWNQLYYEIGGGILGFGLLGKIGAAETLAPSVTRRNFYNELATDILGKLSAVSNTSQLNDFEKTFKNWKNKFYDVTVNAANDWFMLKDRYEREILTLIDEGSLSNFQAFIYLQSIYKETVIRIKKVGLEVVVPDDFLQLKSTLDSDSHIWIGELQAARYRVGELKNMLEVVANLRFKGEDADKIIPGWKDRYSEEILRLDSLAQMDPPREYHYKSLINEAHSSLGWALSAHKYEPGLAEKGFYLIKGAVSAVASPLIEAGKQLIDLFQIELHYRTFGLYEPKFISDTSKAAEQGASTGSLLLGMVTGILETPVRLWEAIKNDDWEGIGREAVNLYALIELAKEGPGKAKETIAKARDALVAAKRMILIFRAKMVGFRGGMAVGAALELLSIAKRENLVIRVRPVSSEIVRLQELGHPVKPGYIKMKTISELDIQLGASPENLGKVGYFEPKLPSEPVKITGKLMDRYGKRMDEWKNMGDKVKKLEADGLIRREGELIVDTKTGKAFTGDSDLFDIRKGGITGEGIEFESLSPETQAKMKSQPIEVQHGAHLDTWDVSPEGVGDFVEIIEKTRPSAKDGSKLVEFHPDGKIRYGYFDD